ncbi:hypothetical protein DET65_0354 [Sunxiuqinia elliptica]|uniref:Uncharacterized protein n=1 Tax=Sunxiuqinia elliptica TaxID=655355 RepID=A0A4R6GQQ6_9BACT|nr:hypothetical protein DET52_10933 [Sunxiuqinia elliptica]TDO66987.1 hypothetical protein DET65_0354 [Sunxiuqinia elliptica]
MIVGIVFTMILIIQPVVDIPRELKESNLRFFNYLLTDFFYNSYLNPNHGVLIYLVGYTIVWWKKLWGAIIILTISVIGLVFSEYGDVRFMYVFTFLVGFLYIMNWKEERKKDA